VLAQPAQTVAPTFNVSANPIACPDAQQGYTCSPTINITDYAVTGGINLSGCDGNNRCHVEYRFSTDSSACPAGGWQNGSANQTTFTYTLPDADDNYGVFGIYRVVQGGQIAKSPWGQGTPPITLILPSTGPQVTLGSPAGIPNSALSSGVQTQNINGTVGQWATYAAYSPDGSAMTINFDGCAGTCEGLPGEWSTATPWTPLWEWTGSTPPPDYTYVTVTAVDDAGNSAMTTPLSTSSFALFTPGTSAVWTCNPSGGNGGSAGLVNCNVLAGPGDNDIPNDSASASVTQCYSPNATLQFSGYADPSMRADPEIYAMEGQTLWMLYSYPNYNWSATGSDCSNTPTVETHLAYSNVTQGSQTYTSGANWVAWCQGASCDSVTAIWPSEPFCTGSIPGIVSSCASACTVNSGAPCFSSHEVPNFWPSVVNGTETWYSAHLMYWVPQNSAISPPVIADGCLVVSAASTPSGLGWAYGSGPNECGTPSSPATFPTGNQPLFFSYLTGIAQTVTGNPDLTCNSWGEPAIMVAAAPTGNTNAIYLATSCLDTNGANTNGYYIFFSQDFTTPMKYSSWTYYAGPFNNYNFLNSGTYTINENTQPVNSMTELDWAVRADGSMVAVVTPMYVPDGRSGHSTTAFQYGCLVFNFYLTTPSAPFGSLVATLDDTDAGDPGSDNYFEEVYGSNGCTYEPMSNTGVVIVRRLADNTSPYTNPVYNLGPNNNETYSIMETGVLP